VGTFPSTRSPLPFQRHLGRKLFLSLFFVWPSDRLFPLGFCLTIGGPLQSLFDLLCFPTALAFLLGFGRPFCHLSLKEFFFFFYFLSFPSCRANLRGELSLVRAPGKPFIPDVRPRDPLQDFPFLKYARCNSIKFFALRLQSFAPLAMADWLGGFNNFSSFFATNRSSQSASSPPFPLERSTSLLRSAASRPSYSTSLFFFQFFVEG